MQDLTAVQLVVEGAGKSAILRTKILESGLEGRNIWGLYRGREFLREVTRLMVASNDSLTKNYTSEKNFPIELTNKPVYY